MEMRAIARTLLSRSVRNWIRSPLHSFQWLAGQRMIRYRHSETWSLNCPKIAAESAFEPVRHDPEQVAEFQDFIRLVSSHRSPLILDIGCHFGVFSFAALHHGDEGTRIHAVDASLHAIRMVERIAKANGLEGRIALRHAAIGEEEGSLEMIDGGPQFAGYFMFPTDQPASDRIRVPQTTIDRIVDSLPRPPDILKLDIESFEYEAIQGAARTLSEASPAVSIELHNEWMRGRGKDPGELLRRFRGHGYDLLQMEGRTASPEAVLERKVARVILRKAGGHDVS